MSEEYIRQRISFILFGANAWRAEFRMLNGILQIRIDVHQMPAAEAKKAIRELILLIPCEMQMCVVHGYHGGTAIKDTLRNEQISDRIYHMESPVYNPGITWMDIADRAGHMTVAA